MEPLTRRRFLQSAAAGAAGAPLLAAPAIARSPRSPNDRIRVAVVGFKRRGMHHIECFHELANQNVEVAALCDVDESVLDQGQALCDKLLGRKVPTYVDVRKLLEDRSIEVISYSTPYHWHALGPIWACQAG